MQVKVNFAGVLAHIARKAGASGDASAESSLTDLKAAISSIDTFGAEGSHAVSAEEVCCSSPNPNQWELGDMPPLLLSGNLTPYLDCCHHERLSWAVYRYNSSMANHLTCMLENLHRTSHQHKNSDSLYHF